MKAQIDSVKDFLGLPRTSMTSHAYVRKLNFDMTTDEIRLEGGSLTELAWILHAFEGVAACEIAKVPVLQGQ